MSLLAEINRQQNRRYKVYGYGDNWKVVDGNKTLDRFVNEEDAWKFADELEAGGPEEKPKNELQKYFDTGLEHAETREENIPQKRVPFLQAMGFEEA